MSRKHESESQAKDRCLIAPTEDGRLKIEVRPENETVGLKQQHMADLCQIKQQNIRCYLQNVVRREGSDDISRSIDFYKLADPLATASKAPWPCASASASQTAQAEKLMQPLGN
jgi:hypothetical protein